HEGFSGNIYCTPATLDLSKIMLLDSSHIQVNDSAYHNKKRMKKGLPEIPPLYLPEDVGKAMLQFKPVDYEQWFSIRPDVSFLIRDNGHILGSGSVTVKIQSRGKEIIIGFTGDIGRPNRPILKDPITMPNCDYLISESTYGARIHEKFPEDTETFWKIVDETCFQRKGKLIIPSFSVGRTQEIVYMLDEMVKVKAMTQLPVYVDSPLSTNATNIYRSHPECFDEDIRNYLLTDTNPFGFNNLNYITEVEQSKALNFDPRPCIIISASGMAEAGRIVHHISNNIEDEKNTLLFVGYCADGTLGQRIRSGMNPIKIFGEEKQVRAHIAIMDSFSAHGDQKEMIDFLNPLDKSRLKKTFLVHGDYDAQTVFRDKLIENGFLNIDIPEQGNEFEIIN
ncbi:MAG TPA: MBL fold metallo-hydrolase, partial [Chitinophagales bacterium]|nr:MBL fold metallo-hydrolase [Chitinophagales bacterium]